MLRGQRRGTRLFSLVFLCTLTSAGSVAVSGVCPSGALLQDSAEIILLISNSDISQFIATCHTHLLPFVLLIFKTECSLGVLRAGRSHVNRETNLPSPGALGT